MIVTKPGAVVTRTDLREFVAARLASFKVPRLVLFRDAIPVGPTGKVRRIGLAQALGVGMAPANEPAPQFVAPRTVTEETVAHLWKDVLRVPQVGVHDRFLDLGGDSILAAQILSRLAETSRGRCRSSSSSSFRPWRNVRMPWTGLRATGRARHHRRSRRVRGRAICLSPDRRTTQGRRCAGCCPI